MSQFTTSDGAIIPFRTKGSGDPIILLHGWSQSGAMFRHQLEELSDNFKVIVPDLRGHGEAPRPKGGLRISRLAKDLSELIEHLSLKQTHVLGWSMGASVVWSYVDLFGTRQLRKVILVDQPSMLTALPEMSQEEIADCGAIFTMQQTEDLCRSLRSPTGDSTRADFVRGMVTPSCPPDLLQWIIDENTKMPKDVAADLLWSHCSQDWRDVLGRIDRATLVICGAVSHVDKRSQYYIQSRIPNAVIREFSAIEGGAHFMFLEAPKSFNETVSKFLGR